MGGHAQPSRGGRADHREGSATSTRSSRGSATTTSGRTAAGYPDGLLGDEIPLAARIIHVADALDAMTTKRLYREELSFEDAMEEIHRGRGTRLLRACVDALERAVAARPDRLADAGPSGGVSAVSYGDRIRRAPSPRAPGDRARLALRHGRRSGRCGGGGRRLPPTSDVRWAVFVALLAGGALAQLFAAHTAGTRCSNGARLLGRGGVAAAAGARRSSRVLQHVPEWLRRRYPWFIQGFNIANVVLAGSRRGRCGRRSRATACT